MIVIPEGFSGKGSFTGGVHPEENKAFSGGCSAKVLPAPPEVNLPLLQHAGAACEPVVQFKDVVTAGQLLARSEAFVSAPVHSPLNGTVGRESAVTLPNGRHVRTLPVTAQGAQLEGQALWDDVYGGSWTTAGLDDFSPEEIADKVREAGIAGQGGAAFPTFIKLLGNPEKPVDFLLVNGCECEPFLTSDQCLMREAPHPIISGALLAARATGARQVAVVVEDNKPDAIEALRAAAEGTSVAVAVVKTRYPMGGEKQLIRAVTGRTVPTGGLPLDAGVAVINVATAAAMARTVLRGKPLTHRLVCVTGGGIRNPANLLVPLGVPVQTLIDFCGGLTEDAARVVSGGPMMGFALNRLDVPVTKGTSGITVLTGRDVQKSKETACVRCGRCAEVCPLNLVPTRMALAVRAHQWELAKRWHIQACMECGCCAYACPAGLPLVQLIRNGKTEIIKESKKA